MDSTPQRLEVARVAIMTTERYPAAVLRSLAEGHAVPGQRYEFDGATLWWIPTEQPRWHEIATEGLPPEGGDCWVYGEAIEPSVRVARFTVLRPHVPTWMFVVGDDIEVEAGRITHWMPCPLPAPPTTERR